MTVVDLITKLQNMEPDAEVFYACDGYILPVTDTKIISPEYAGLPSYHERPILLY